MPTESPGHVAIKGRFGDMQAITDAVDTLVTIPAAATHVEFSEWSDQIFWYSFTGAAGSWEAVHPSSRRDSKYRVGIAAGAVSVYLRKAYNPRILQPRPELTTLPARERLADDRILPLVVLFSAD